MNIDLFKNENAWFVIVMAAPPELRESLMAMKPDEYEIHLVEISDFPPEDNPFLYNGKKYVLLIERTTDSRTYCGAFCDCTVSLVYGVMNVDFVKRNIDKVLKYRYTVSRAVCEFSLGEVNDY